MLSIVLIIVIRMHAFGSCGFRWLLFFVDNSLIIPESFYFQSLLLLSPFSSLRFSLLSLRCQILSNIDHLILTTNIQFLVLSQITLMIDICSFAAIVTVYRTHLILFYTTGLTCLFLPSLFKSSTFYNTLAPMGVLPMLSSQFEPSSPTFPKANLLSVLHTGSTSSSVLKQFLLSLEFCFLRAPLPTL